MAQKFSVDKRVIALRTVSLRAKNLVTQTTEIVRALETALDSDKVSEMDVKAAKDAVKTGKTLLAHLSKAQGVFE